MLKGIPASPGIIMGEVFFLEKVYTIKKHHIPSFTIDEEINRFKKAVKQTEEEIEKIKKQLLKGMGKEYSRIFDIHLLFLKDNMFIQQTINKIKTEKVNVEYILEEFLNEISKNFSQIEDEYLKERKTDIHDVVKRVIKKLLGIDREDLAHLTKKVIVVTHELSPSDTAIMQKEKVIGVATDIGGRTSHTAIIARSLEIPAVVGLKNITAQIQTGDKMILDGHRGIVIINPSKKAIDNYHLDVQKNKRRQKSLEKLKNLAAETVDKHRVSILANIELLEEINSVLDHGGEGIGLFRTEFLYMNRLDLPTEEEQFEVYKAAALKMRPYPVIIRTLDLGGDKFVSHLNFPQEINPFLGWRAIRFCLEKLEIFKTQLRAILRASVYGNLKIMFPLISSLSELRKANNFLKKTKQELDEEDIPYDREIEVGIMIEVPSSVIISDILAKETNFFSIGTNDLIQYTLAVDRINEKIAHLYKPLHPGILRMIKSTVINAHNAGIWVTVCGEMAADPFHALILLGLGIDELSMSAVSIPLVKKAIRSLKIEYLKTLVADILCLSNSEEIENYLKIKLSKLLPSLNFLLNSYK